MAIVARLDNNHLVLPWERDRAAEAFRKALAEPEFAARIQRGEQAELVAKQPERAVEAYRQAVGGARHPAQAAHARLLLARVLAKLQRTSHAVAAYRRMLALPPDLVDEHGVPFCLYAAGRLLEAGVDRAEVREKVRDAMARQQGFGAAHAYLVRSLVERLAAKDLEAALGQRLAVLNQAMALQRDFSRLPIRRGDAVWAPYGDDLWLVSVAPPLGQVEPVVVAVRARQVCDAPLRAGADAAGEPLGDSFPGLKATLDQRVDAALARQFDLRRSFYFAALGLAFAVTLSGGWLVWRDVRRELHMAELRSQFVSSVSHELKTPLTAIRMFAETLRLGRSADPASQQEYLETIVNESERLTRLVDNVLDFSKIEQGKKIYHPRQTSLRDVVDAAARAMQYPLAQQGFRLRVEADAGLPPVQADPDAMEQAVLNLLTNAMKYSGEARDIDLRLHPVNGRAVIQVTDRGVGIAPEEHSRIFDKYYRVATRENRLVPGTGLGLTLVAHTVKAHGGDVTVRSAPGQGSTFEIHLPLEERA